MKPIFFLCENIEAQVYLQLGKLSYFLVKKKRKKIQIEY